MIPTRVVDQKPAVRRRSRYFVFGVLFTLERQIHDETIRTEVFAPALIRPRDRSKYMPHQGKQEMYRRRVGGWAYNQRLADFYGFPALSGSKRETLRELNDPSIGYA